MGNKPVQCYMGTSVPNKEQCPLLCTHFPFEMNWAGLWIPWWKNAVLLKSAKKKKDILGSVQRMEYLGSTNGTGRHLPSGHNGCCGPLSIVGFPLPHPVLPHNTSPPLFLEKKHGVKQWILTLFVFKHIPPVRSLPWLSLPGRWEQLMAWKCVQEHGFPKWWGSKNSFFLWKTNHDTK